MAGNGGGGRGPSITTKVNLIIILTLTLGIGGMTFFFGWSLISTREALSREASAQAGDLLYQSIKNFMIPGEAPLAVNLFNDIALIRPDFNIALFRSTGLTAFSDNTTLETVNKNIGKEKFMAHERPPSANPMAPIQPWFQQSLSPMPGEVFFTTAAEGRTFSHAYRPLLNLPKCTGCHGSTHTVRGVIDIMADVTSAVRAQSVTVWITGGLFLGVLALLAFVLSRYLHRVVLIPVKAIGLVCARVAGGDFGGRVTVAGRDEIAGLASTVNGMVVGLKERSELTKYVSGSTIESLQGDQSGRRIGRVMFISDIRGFTSYSEKSEPEKVVMYLNRILDIQSQILAAEGGDVDKFVGDAVVAVFSQDGGAAAACRAALAIRDRLRNAGDEFNGLAVGMGITLGDVIQGMIGSARRADFTVIGDPVNTASRLCSIAKAGEILVSDAAKAAAGGDLVFTGPFKAKLKGRDKPQVVYYLTGRNPE